MVRLSENEALSTFSSQGLEFIPQDQITLSKFEIFTSVFLIYSFFH